MLNSPLLEVLSFVRNASRRCEGRSYTRMRVSPVTDDDALDWCLFIVYTANEANIFSSYCSINTNSYYKKQRKRAVNVSTWIAVLLFISRERSPWNTQVNCLWNIRLNLYWLVLFRIVNNLIWDYIGFLGQAALDLNAAVNWCSLGRAGCLYLRFPVRYFIWFRCIQALSQKCCYQSYTIF